MSLLSKHIFITKNLSEVDDLLEQVSNEGGRLNAQSLISFEGIPFDSVPETDIIFFSSPRGVRFFLECSKALDTRILACVGKSTAQALEDLGFEPKFTGSDEQSIEEVAKAFKVFAGTRSVLFPSSDISLGTIASALHESQVYSFPIYQTELKPIHVDVADIYVFTSPSNVRSFFKENTIPENALVIAWGNSTSQELENFNIESKKLGTPSVKCLIQYLTEH